MLCTTCKHFCWFRAKAVEVVLTVKSNQKTLHPQFHGKRQVLFISMEKNVEVLPEHHLGDVSQGSS
jgi:hypothetical protein